MLRDKKDSSILNCNLKKAGFVATLPASNQLNEEESLRVSLNGLFTNKNDDAKVVVVQTFKKALPKKKYLCSINCRGTK